MITVISKLRTPGAACWPCCGFSEISCHTPLLHVFLHLDKLITNGMHIFKASENCHICHLIRHIFCRKYRTGGGKLAPLFSASLYSNGTQIDILNWTFGHGFCWDWGSVTAVYHQWCLAHGTLSVDLTLSFWTWIGVTTDQQARGWGLFIVRSKASRWQDDVLWGCPQCCGNWPKDSQHSTCRTTSSSHHIIKNRNSPRSRILSRLCFLFTKHCVCLSV